MEKGSKTTTTVEIVKIKKGKPTVIHVFGDRYVLDLKTPKRKEKKQHGR